MKRTKLNQRKRSRGAAMVESAVFMPIFITMWVSIGFLGGAYRTKLFTKKYAREYTWGMASTGCKTTAPKDTDDTTSNAGASSQVTETTNGQSPGGSEPGVTSALSDPNVNKNGGPNLDAATASLSFSDKAKSPWNSSVTGYLSEGATYTSKIAVMCNEVPVDGNLLSEIKKAACDAFSSLC